MPGKESIKEPSKKPQVAQVRGTVSFSKFWTAWPQAAHPRNRDHVERIFSQLTADDQALAIKFIDRYIAVQKSRNSFALMLPYLKNSLFHEFIGAPEIDRDGYFIITPDRKEWPIWLDHLQRHYGVEAASATQKRGFFLATSRDPEVLSRSKNLTTLSMRASQCLTV